MVEVTSVSPGAGKTQFLYHVIALSILPRTYGENVLNGQNSAIIVIDADDRFDISRLAEVINSYITRKSKGRDPQKDNTDDFDTTSGIDTADLISHVLQHVHVFRPQSLSSLVATVRSLDAYLFDMTAHQSSQRPLGAMILDGASAFFWQHRAEEDAARLKDAEPRAADTTAESNQSAIPAYSLLLAALRKASKTFDCPIIFTSQSSVFAGHDRGSFHERSSSKSHLRSLLPPSWTTFTTVRLVFERAKTVQFAPGMSAEEAWEERALRQEVVDRGIFRGKVIGGSRDQAFEFTVRHDGISMLD